MSSGYGAGQRMPAQQTYEAPACVQNAMMTKDKKPFTYTPGGIDLSQIKSERMAKRLARNAQAEGATGIQQQNRPTQPQSPGGCSPNVAASMGAAAMGMPFQVLPPPPPPSPGKSFNGGSAAAPPPPPSSSNFSNVGTLAPPTNGNGVGGRGSAPNSPNMSRKTPTPQRFEPPPMGFRPEIKIPPNPMAALRKVPPPVEKNTFWKDEYVKERSKSPMVDTPSHQVGNNNDSVNSNSSSPQTTNANNYGTAILNNDNTDGFKKTMPTTNNTNNSMQQNQTNNNYTNYQQQPQQQQLYTPPTPSQQPQQSPIRPLQQSPQYGGPQPPTAQLQQTHISPQTTQPQQKQQPQQPTYRPEFRSVAAPTSPAVNVYTRQTADSPRAAENTTPPRATESPFKFSQQQQQQRAPPAVSPLAQQQSTPSTSSSGASVSPNNPAQTVPWRNQRGPSQQSQQPAQPSVVAQSHPQPIYNNVQQQPQRTPDFSTQQSPYQGPKPTNVGSLYIAPLAPPTEPQAQHIVRQQMQQQQQQHRDSPIRQMAPHQQQQPNQQLRWMSSQPMKKEQPAWARPEENGNVVPSSLNRIKSPPPPTSSSSSPTQATHQTYQPSLTQGNGFMPQTGSHNFGAQPINTTGLRLQINSPINQANTQNAPKERIIPIQLEQTPTYSPVQPSFNHGAGTNYNSQKYVPPSEQQAPEPKKYTGSAIPSRSFKILQAMTQPENADKIIKDKQENCAKNNEINEIESKPENIHYKSCASNSSNAEPALSSSSTTINSELIFSSSSPTSTPTPPPTQPISSYPPYPYPYGYPWYLPPPPHHISTAQNIEHGSPQNWPYPYGLPATPTAILVNGNREQPAHYPPYPYYYPYYPPPPPPPPPLPHSQNASHTSTPSSEYDMASMYPSYMPPPHPYLAYPYPVAPSYSQGSNSSRASSVLPDIIITPSTDEVPSKVIMQHHIKVERDQANKKRAGSIDIEDVTSLKSHSSAEEGGSVIDILAQQLDNMQSCLKNNLNTKCQSKNVFEKNIEQKSPEENTSPIQIPMEITEPEREQDHTSSDSEITPKQMIRKLPVPLKSIRSVNNVQIYKSKQMQQMELNTSSDSEDDEDDETTADGESDIFDEEDDHNFAFEKNDSEAEEFIVADNLSVIYEEESEMETKAIKQNGTKNNESMITEEEDPEDSTSVTVRLPLKFSFSSSKNDENIATLEVGKSQVEEQRNKNAIINGKCNNFNVASIKSSDTEDSEDDDGSEDCDVSVTISLSPSSRSSSLNKPQIYKNMDHLYPIEDMPLPEEVFDQLGDSSQEDASVSFSLNMRNKFANETKQDGVTNNIALLEADKETLHKKDAVNDVEVPEELDFFATLMATKMQAQKIKEQSASYWGKSQEKATENEENWPEKTKNKESKLNNGRKKTLKKTKSKAKIAAKIDDHKENGEMKTNKTKEIEDTSLKMSEKCEKPKFSFWDRCSAGSTEKKITKQKLNKPNENKPAAAAESKPMPTEPKQITNQQQDDMKTCSPNSANTHLNSQPMESGADVQEAEEIADIWADREEDLPPIKPIKSKLKSLESIRQSFWSSVRESEKEPDKINEDVPHKPLLQAEMINNVDLHINSLSYSVNELSQPQQAFVEFVAEENAEESEESEEVDFWAEINKSKLSKPSDTKQEHSTSSNLQGLISNGYKLPDSFPEQEYSMYQDDNMSTLCQFDPLKYPEEPREVDTDEEIDFWAEIEAKRLATEDDVTFHKSASFWASKERQNSVDETPYKPVLPKAFNARLPDEPPSENISIWAALEAHKGEEPIIIDPMQEEEKFLAQQYDIMITKQDAFEEKKFENEPSLPHQELNTAALTQTDHKLAAAMEPQTSNDTKLDKPKNVAARNEIDELEIKRSNYRKAMAFFSTSIDENKAQSIERHERGKNKSGRHSSYIEDEKWDWEAVNEALKQETVDKVISVENKPQEVFAEEQTTQAVIEKDHDRLWETQDFKSTQNDIESSYSCNSHDVAATTAVITKPNSKPEINNDLQEVCQEPTLKLLANGLPNLEVNKSNEDRKMSVKDRISAFETGTVEISTKQKYRNSLQKQCLSVESNTRQSSLSRNSSTQRSESEMDEDDSGVTDMNRQLSETDTESESFPELRKMSSYQRAATHSRLFKLLQEDPDVQESSNKADEYQFKSSRRKIVHNVSITRKQNPTALVEAETISQRRERLSLPLLKNTSIDNDNPSTPNSPVSPIMSHTVNKSPVVSEKLVSELVQSLLLKSDSTHFKKLPMEKLQAAAKRVLEEELDSLQNTSIDSTPALTPSDMKKDKSYYDYYNTWSDAVGAEDIVPSKSFRALQDSRRSPWTARCPRVLSSKAINRDLARVTESPEISVNSRQTREASIGKWKS